MSATKKTTKETFEAETSTCETFKVKSGTALAATETGQSSDNAVKAEIASTSSTKKASQISGMAFKVKTASTAHAGTEKAGQVCFKITEVEAASAVRASTEKEAKYIRVDASAVEPTEVEPTEVEPTIVDSAEVDVALTIVLAAEQAVKAEPKQTFAFTVFVSTTKTSSQVSSKTSKIKVSKIKPPRTPCTLSTATENTSQTFGEPP